MSNDLLTRLRSVRRKGTATIGDSDVTVTSVIDALEAGQDNTGLINLLRQCGTAAVAGVQIAEVISSLSYDEVPPEEAEVETEVAPTEESADAGSSDTDEGGDDGFAAALFKGTDDEPAE